MDRADSGTCPRAVALRAALSASSPSADSNFKRRNLHNRWETLLYEVRMHAQRPSNLHITKTAFD